MSDLGLKALHTALPLQAASTIIDAALRLGRECELAALTVAVLDLGGNLLAFKREIGRAHV
jgi:uncharacterized protein GlcG (DUF336 family)